MNPQTLLFSHTLVQKFIFLKFLRFWTGDSGLYRPGDSGLEESPPLRAEYPDFPPETSALNPGDSDCRNIVFDNPSSDILGFRE